MNVKENVLDVIGNTPLIRLKNIEREYDLSSRLFAKLERCNPTGSIKDRIAKEMILDALKEGKITKESILIEPTSGNTGIGLAAVAASLGMKIIIFMPENASKERVLMMKAFGAEVILTPKELGMGGSVKMAVEKEKTIKGSFIVGQFDNPNNNLAHYKGTGPEIYRDLDGMVDAYVASFGTGGTLTGTARFLKEKNPNILVVGLEPASSPLVSEGKAGPHKIQGIGANFIPKDLEMKYVDKVISISDEDAYYFTRLLTKKEGLLCGISSGCNLAGVISIAKANENKNIVTIFPDNGERYLSVEGLYE